MLPSQFLRCSSATNTFPNPHQPMPMNLNSIASNSLRGLIFIEDAILNGVKLVEHDLQLWPDESVGEPQLTQIMSSIHAPFWSPSKYSRKLAAVQLPASAS